MITKLGSVFARIVINPTWSMLADRDDPAFVRLRTWGYCLRHRGRVVDENELHGAPLPMLNFLERYTFAEAPAAGRIVAHLIDTCVRPRHDYDHVDILVYSRWRSPAPDRRLVRGFEREVIVSVSLVSSSALSAAITIPSLPAMA